MLKPYIWALLSKVAHLLLGTKASELETRALLLRLTLERFYELDVGKPYHVDRKDKEELLARFQTIKERIPSATNWLYHIVLAKEILSIPRDVQGSIVECGSWKGASTASLSLVCAKAGRKLFVCDSFEGLPEDRGPSVHVYPHLSVYGYYHKGMYAGRLEEVKENISRYGDLSICTFVPGLFQESLKALSEPIVFAFLDVDLPESMKDCLRYIWPLLVDGGLIYTDDSCDMEVVRIWFDDPWWQRELGCRAPGYVGSGCGLPVSTDFSSLGYARKIADPVRSYKRVSWLHYPDSQDTNRQQKNEH